MIRWLPGCKVFLVLIAGGLALGATDAQAQTVFLSGSSQWSDNPWSKQQAGFRFGTGLRLSEQFQIQGALTYLLEVNVAPRPFSAGEKPRNEKDFLAAEAALHMRPFARWSMFDLYMIAGFGGFIDGDESRLVVPLGSGVEYRLNENLGLLLELTGRWSFMSRREFGFMAALGVSYKLSRLGLGRRRAATPPVEPLDSAETRPFVVGEEAGVAPPPVQGTMVLLPDGLFILGLTDEDPLQLQTAGLRRITLSRFYIDQFEVSNADYLRFVAEAPPERRAALLPDTTMQQVTGQRFSGSEYLRGSAFAKHPVVGVTYEQAEAYCTFYDKRLPTEAEWEYAARAGRLGGVYPWPGLEPRDESGRFLANYNPGRGGYAADGHAFTAPVDAFPPSAWELYNMSGNVAEWCQDTFHPSYSTLSDFNPLFIDAAEARRVVRGGSWASDAFYIGVGVRDAQVADEASPYIGFRCVKDVAKTDGEQP